MSDINANLEELFPELQGLLNGWDNGNGGGEPVENENGVEPGSIEAEIQRRLANGQTVGPSPINGAAPQMMPQFRSGQSAAAPPSSHVEDGGPPNAQPPESAPVAPVQPEGTDESVQPAAAPPAPSPDEVEVGQREDGTPIRVPKSLLQAYATFDEEFQENEGLREAVLTYYRSQGVGTTEAAPASSPQSPLPTQPTLDPTIATQPPAPELDLEDPNIRFLVEQQAQLREQIAMLTTGVQATYNQQQQRAAAENDGLIRRAMESFKQQHGLDDSAMNELRQSAARLNVVPALLQGIDPITGAPSKPDPLTALDRAFEIAYLMNPENRKKEFAREIQQRVTDSRRKQKLAGLAGSSGSVPRTTPAPTTETGRREAMVSEFAQMMAGEWSPPET